MTSPLKEPADKIEIVYGYGVLRHEAQVIFIPPTRMEWFICTCWEFGAALLQIALYFALIMSVALVLRFVTH